MDLHAPELAQLRLYVYRRPLHPELFTIFLEKRIDTGKYEAQLWLIGTGHLISFHCPGVTLSELLTSRADLLPEKGLVEALPVDKPQDYRVTYENQLYYLLNVQSEQMSDGVFVSVHEEMSKFAQTRGMFMRFDQWAVEGQLPPFSFIDYERRPNELDVFTYHAFPEQKVMVRTQSVFSLEPISMQTHSLHRGPFGKNF
ncbi:MAG: DUF2617 family protein [Phycisphaerae bacterium]